MRKLARVFFEDGLRGLGQWRVKKNDCCLVFTERLRDAREMLCQDPHTDASVTCRETEFDQLPVRPLTSFEVAQSSRTMRVFVPSKAKLANFSHISTWCCSQIITKSRGSLSPNRYSVLLYAKVGQISTMKSNLPLNGPQSWFTRN